MGDVPFVALSFRRLYQEARWGPVPGYAHVGRSTQKRNDDNDDDALLGERERERAAPLATIHCPNAVCCPGLIRSVSTCGNSAVLDGHV
jgi:hypothetical protein